MSDVHASVHDPFRPRRLIWGRSWRRKMNGWLNWLQARRFHNSQVWGYPKHLILDPTNICNLRCPLCPSGLRALRRPRGMMDALLFRKILRELGPYLYTLTLTNWGEPLLHPGLTQMIRFAKRFPIFTGLGTNLHFLPPPLADDLIHSGLDAIAVSIDGCDQQTYETYRVGGSLSMVLGNLERLLNARSRAGMKTPAIRWQSIITRHNEHQMGAIEALARKTGVDEVLFVPAYLDIAGMFIRPPQTRLAKDSAWLPQNEALNLYDRETGKLKQAPTLCRLLWESAVVNWDGSVSPCCAVIDKRHDFGALAARSFRDIWNSPSYIAARRVMTGGPLPGLALPCEICAREGVPIY